MKDNIKKILNKNIITLMLIPIVLSIVFIIISFLLLNTYPKALNLFLVIGIVFILVNVGFVIYYRQRIFNVVITYIASFNKTQSTIIENMDIPLVVILESGRLIWHNDSFGETISDSLQLGDNIYKSVAGLKDYINNEYSKNHKFLYNGRIYRLNVMPMTKKDKLKGQFEDNLISSDAKMIAIYFYDETTLMEYVEKYHDEKIVTALIYIDNYDEIINQVEDVRRSLLGALIDRKISKYFGEVDGIAKKMENDKYFVIFKEKYYNTLVENKFSIVDAVKDIKVGNVQPPTLSIGIGYNASNYNESYEFAANAIEMALSRGGDQVVVKSPTGFNFFGKSSEQTTSRSRVKARVMADTIRDCIQASSKVIIMGHELADVDCIGSAIGVYKIAISMGKECHIIVNQTTASTLLLLKRFNESSEYPTDMFISSKEAMLTFNNDALLIIVDTNSPNLVESEDLVKIAKQVVVIDHHRQGSDYIKKANVSYVEPQASSASELVTEIIEHIDNSISLTPLEAESLYSGIILDTNNFLTKTGVRTFETAAYLRKCGADVTRVRKIFRDDSNAYKAKADVVKNAMIYKDHYAISVFPDINIDSPTIIGAQAANELLNIDKIKASFVLTKYNGKIYLSARSIDEVNVQLLCEKLGGGGHMSMAGAQFAHTNMPEAVESLKQVIDEYDG